MSAQCLALVSVSRNGSQRFNKRRFRAPLIAAVLAVSPTFALGQAALVNKGAWTVTTPAPTYLNPADSSGVFQAGTTYGGTRGVGLARAGGTLTDNGASQSLFNATTVMSQKFDLTTTSVVQVPSYLIGSVAFTNGAANSGGSATYQIQILNAANAVVYTTTRSYNAFAPTSGTVNDRVVSLSPDLPAGSYTVKATLTVTAQDRLNAAAGNANGGVTSTDFFNPIRGGATGISAWAVGIGDSRSAVTAPAARAAYNVDGTGVIVGVLEPGRAYVATDPTGIHSSLAGAGKLTLANNAIASDPRYRSEHAQAVASIIAGRNATTNDPQLNGVAPGASILDAAYRSYGNANVADRVRAGLDELVAGGARIVNASFGRPQGAGAGTDPDGLGAVVTQVINANPDLLYVQAAGNESGGQLIAPAQCYNSIVVGGLDRTFTSLGDYSSIGSFGGAYFPKPDLVAPGDQIAAAGALPNYYTRGFSGETFDQANGDFPSVGTITGTSFAAPHVSGAAALLYQKATQLYTDKDHRVMKAVLMNAAGRKVTHMNGAAWTQTTIGSIAGNDYQVTQNLDTQLGAGNLDTNAAMKTYVAGEARVADNAQPFLKIDVKSKPDFWDLQAVSATDNVDYLLGGIPKTLRALVDWDAPNVGDLPNLEMRLYREGTDGENVPGYDGNDTLVATTESRVAGVVNQNVGLFDFTNLDTALADGGGTNSSEYFLSIFNLSNTETSYGLAVSYTSLVPEPTTLLAIGLMLTFARRRRV